MYPWVEFASWEVHSTSQTSCFPIIYFPSFTIPGASSTHRNIHGLTSDPWLHYNNRHRMLLFLYVLVFLYNVSNIKLNVLSKINNTAEQLCLIDLSDYFCTVVFNWVIFINSKEIISCSQYCWDMVLGQVSQFICRLWHFTLPE